MQNLISKIENLEKKVKFLEASATIPKNVEDAFRERLRMETFTPLEASSKSATSETQVVNEAGVSPTSYSLLKQPDGWEQRTVNGSFRYYPYWT